MNQKPIRYLFLFTFFFSACRTVSTPEPSPVPGMPDAIPGMTRLELDTSGLYESPSWSPDGQFLAYSRIEFIIPGLNPSTAEIYVIDLATGQLTQVTNNNEIDLEPDWSPDGTSIVFERAENIHTGPYKLMTIDPNGRNEKKLLDCPAQCNWPVWSPDGQQIAFVMNGISIINFDGTGLRQLKLHEFALVNAPTWSPDGNRLAFLATKEHIDPVGLRAPEMFLGEYNLLTGEEKILSKSTHYDPDWSPDGSQILFSAGLDSVTTSKKWTLFTIDISNGSKHRLISEDLNYDIFNAAWSPDGSKIAFAFGSITGTSSLYILDLTQLSE